MTTAKNKIPILVLCGFLGSGKTTLLNHILKNSKDRKIAVIVNEFGEVNIDAGLIKHTTEKTIELTNGCICCTLRGDLIQGVHDLLEEHTPDYIVIESTGIGEPIPIAQAFYVPAELLVEQQDLPDIQSKVYVDSLVTVVDSAQFMHMYTREGTIEEDEFDRGYGQLLAEQIEGANIVVLNKTDVSSAAQRLQLTQLIESMNPDAHVLEASYGQADLAELVGKRLFNIRTASESTLWIEELESEHVPESEEYGLESWVYVTSERFDEKKLVQVLDKGLPEHILRSKGLVALAGTEKAFLWNQAGKFLKFEQIGQFNNPATMRTEIVFIGSNIDRAYLENLFSSALATIDPSVNGTSAQ